jgi:hypothetical protein
MLSKYIIILLAFFSPNFFKRENKNHYRTFLVNLFMNFFRVMHLLHIQILLSNKGPI